MAAPLKRILIGRPIASAEEHQHRLSKKVALPVFASDAIWAILAGVGLLVLPGSSDREPPPRG